MKLPMYNAFLFELRAMRYLAILFSAYFCEKAPSRNQVESKFLEIFVLKIGTDICLQK